MTYLECRNIELRAGHLTLLSGVSLAIEPSQTLAITGPNGCGKTSLLRVLAGISRPHFGDVFCMKEQLWPARKVQHEHLCFFLAHTPTLLMDHSVLDNLRFFTRSFGICQKKNSDYDQALKRVLLSGRQKQIVRTLSSGQKRRLTLAALLLIKPHIILADEPTNGLDLSGRNLCLEIFDQLRLENNTAVVVATHDDLLTNWCQSRLHLVHHAVSQKAIQNKISRLL